MGALALEFCSIPGHISEMSTSPGNGYPCSPPLPASPHHTHVPRRGCRTHTNTHQSPPTYTHVRLQSHNSSMHEQACTHTRAPAPGHVSGCRSA